MFWLVFGYPVWKLVLLGLMFIVFFVFSLINFKSKDDRLAYIVVLGDLGRSPRMNYHCLSLVKSGFRVLMIGYKENRQLNEIESNPNVTIIPLKPYPKHLQVGPQSIQYFLKTIFLSLTLLFCLLIHPVLPKFVLVQNPPSIPTLGLVYFFSKLSGSKFIIDWHNYGFTILALKNGPKHLLVKICKFFETYFGQKSDANLCVTDAMKDDLEKNFQIKAITMHDKAHDRFRQLTLEEKHDFYLRLRKHYDLTDFGGENEDSTSFTELSSDGGSVVYKRVRPALIVSSSSWTEDEDFNLLVEALDIYEQDASATKRKIICALTGKGPLKEHYEALFANKQFKNIRVNFIWLDPKDYPLLLGSADLGICFHKSSSNLDLPMKVVDMFGARLPVCALKFPCISELVKENENGLLFESGSELAQQLKELLNENLNCNDTTTAAAAANGDASSPRVLKFRKNLQTFSNWSDEWNGKVKNLFLTI